MGSVFCQNTNVFSVAASPWLMKYELPNGGIDAVDDPRLATVGIKHIGHSR